MVWIVDGKVLIFAGADGSEEVRKKYKLEVSLKKPGNGRMEIVSASEIVPIDMIYDYDQVIESYRAGFVPDRLMQRFYFKEEGRVQFKVKIEIRKW